MTKRTSISLLALVGILGGWTGRAADSEVESIERAKGLFEEYVELEKAFDPAVADLYSDEAVITNRRTYPTGQVRELAIPAVPYKELLRQAMPLAKQLSDTNRYSDCSYRSLGEKVEIKCQRFAERKKYTSPIRLVVGPAATGKWVIHEEHSESIP